MNWKETDPTFTIIPGIFRYHSLDMLCTRETEPVLSWSRNWYKEKSEYRSISLTFRSAMWKWCFLNRKKNNDFSLNIYASVQSSLDQAFTSMISKLHTQIRWCTWNLHGQFIGIALQASFFFFTFRFFFLHYHHRWW